MPEILACGELVAADLAELVDKYLPGSHALNINQPVSVDTGAAIRHGIFKGLNEDGAMILIQEDGTEITIYAGDVRATNHQEK